MGGIEIDGAMRASAVESLLAHLGSPETSAADLVHIIRALGAIGQGAELQPIGHFVLTYRADPTLASQVTVLSTAIDVLLDHGGAAQRELVAYIAADERTETAVAEYAARALLVTDSDHSHHEAGSKAAPAPAAK
jgi:hypothetical protein